jgi:hypothetical protein
MAGKGRQTWFLPPRLRFGRCPGLRLDDLAQHIGLACDALQVRRFKATVVRDGVSLEDVGSFGDDLNGLMSMLRTFDRIL